MSFNVRINGKWNATPVAHFPHVPQKFEVVSAAYHGGGVNMMKTKADGSLSEADESPCLLVAMTAMAFPCMAYFRHIAALYRKSVFELHADKNTVACQCRDDVNIH